MRQPAEWERQRATLLAWPGGDGDWASSLAEIRAEYTALLDAVLAHQRAVVLLQSKHDIDGLPFADHPSLFPVEIAHNDTWCRDYGPICLTSTTDASVALNFTFDAWGGKYQAGEDNRVNEQLLKLELLRDFERVDVDLELEGGAIDSNGAGRLLVNWSCLEKRLPQLDRRAIDSELRRRFHLNQIHGIDLPALPGDDTDGHIDTIARFAAPGTIVYQQHQDQRWTETLSGQLRSMTDDRGRPYELIALPEVAGFDPTLPANYANFLFVNGACLVPAYGVKSDGRAQRLLAELLPEHEVIPIPARTMITQFGGPHCATMHIPEPTR